MNTFARPDRRSSGYELAAAEYFAENPSLAERAGDLLARGRAALSDLFGRIAKAGEHAELDRRLAAAIGEIDEIANRGLDARLDQALASMGIARS